MSGYGIAAIALACLLVYVFLGETAMWFVAGLFFLMLIGLIFIMRREGSYTGPSTLVDDARNLGENFGFSRVSDDGDVVGRVQNEDSAS